MGQSLSVEYKFHTSSFWVSSIESASVISKTIGTTEKHYVSKWAMFAEPVATAKKEGPSSNSNRTQTVLVYLASTSAPHPDAQRLCIV